MCCVALSCDASPAQMRQLVAALRASSALRPAPRESPVGAAAALVEAVRQSPQRKAAFLSEDGAVAIIELLSSRKPEVSPKSLKPYITEP